MISFSSLEIIDAKGEKQFIQDWSFLNGITFLQPAEAGFLPVLTFSFFGVTSGSLVMDGARLTERNKASVLKFSFSFDGFPSFDTFFVFKKSLRRSLFLLSKVIFQSFRIKFKKAPCPEKYSHAIDLCLQNGASYFLFEPFDSLDDKTKLEIKTILMEKTGVFIVSSESCLPKKSKNSIFLKTFKDAPAKLHMLRLFAFLFSLLSVSEVFLGSFILSKEINSVFVVIFLSLLAFSFCFINLLFSYAVKRKQTITYTSFETVNFLVVFLGELLGYSLYFCLQKAGIIQTLTGSLNAFFILLAFLLIFSPLLAKPLSKSYRSSKI